MESTKGTKSIQRTFDIIDLLSMYQSGLRLTDISNKSSIPISTVHRILRYLFLRNYVSYDKKNHTYFIGSRFSYLSAIYLKGFNFIKDIRPILEELNQHLDETIHLGILDNSAEMVVYVDKLESSRTIRMFSQIGQIVPVHCTALGKSLLSNLPDKIIGKVLSNYSFKKYTENTIISKEEFIKEIEKVRKQGYAIDNQEHEETVMCIGRSFSNQRGEVIAAVSVSIPAYRFSKHDFTLILKSFEEAISSIESRVSQIIP